MIKMSLFESEAWAQSHFGGADLGDQRRSRRLVALAGALARRPSGSLSQALPDWGQLRAAYRLLENDAVSFSGVLTPHWQRTRAACTCQPPGSRLLLIEDTTSLDFGSRKATQGLGPIGDGRGRGLYLHSTLAVRVEAGQSADPAVGATLIGLAAQSIWARPAQGVGSGRETKACRLARKRESERWAAALQGCAPRAAGTQTLYVADRESDIFEVFGHCQSLGLDWVVRACQPRALVAATVPAAAQAPAGGGSQPPAREDSPPTNVFAAVKSAPVLGEMAVRLRARSGQAARTARLEVRAVEGVCLRAPWRPGKGRTLPAQRLNVVEVREVDAPAGVLPISWTLLTSLAVDSARAACEVVAFYSRRWLIEEYHKALKSGVGIEQSQLRERAHLEPLIGVLAVVALRLLALKLLSRLQPHAPADPAFLGGEAYAVLQAHGLLPVQAAVTHVQLWVAIARLGGFLARKGDGPPGWQSLWRGWQRLSDLAEGVRLAQRFLQP